MHSTSWLKETLRGFIPPVILRLRQQRRNRKRLQYSERLWTTLEGQVATGPFQGMKYVREAVGSSIGPKLLGTYEAELHSNFEPLITHPPERIIVVGAAEGYYAIGLLLRCPNSIGWAFEAEQKGCDLIRQMAERNDVQSRIQIHGFCNPEDLKASLVDTHKPLIIMDVEGAEEDLLDPELIPALQQSTIVVEIHELIRPGVTTKILKRFEPGHHIQRIPTSGTASIPAIPGFSNRQLQLLADEMRPKMEWLVMSPLEHS